MTIYIYSNDNGENQQLLCGTGLRGVGASSELEPVVQELEEVPLSALGLLGAERAKLRFSSSACARFIAVASTTASSLL